MRGAGRRVRRDFSYENERTTPTPQVEPCQLHGHDPRDRPAACPPGPPQPCRGVVPSIAVLRRAKEMSAALLLFYFGFGSPAKSLDFAGRGGATERVDFGTFCPEEAKRSLRRRVPRWSRKSRRHPHGCRLFLFPHRTTGNLLNKASIIGGRF